MRQYVFNILLTLIQYNLTANYSQPIFHDSLCDRNCSDGKACRANRAKLWEGSKRGYEVTTYGSQWKMLILNIRIVITLQGIRRDFRKLGTTDNWIHLQTRQTYLICQFDFQCRRSRTFINFNMTFLEALKKWHLFQTWFIGHVFSFMLKLEELKL